MLPLFSSLALAISDGVTDTADHAVVGIVDSSTSAECTGTLIAPDVVLTARHCVARFVGNGCEATWGATFSPDRLYVTTRDTLTFNASDYRQAAEVVVDEAQTALCGGDVALLILGEAVPEDEALPLAPRVDEPVTVGELYAAVGFGGTDDFGAGSGVRRRRDGLAAACLGPCAGAAAGEWVGEAGVCGGDSGGPALDAAGRVIGVASRGAVGCISPTYGSVADDGWAVFLREAVTAAATAGGYPTPDWVLGDTGDSGLPDTAAVDDTGGSGAPKNCGCSAGPAPGMGALMPGLLALRRRRARVAR